MLIEDNLQSNLGTLSELENNLFFSLCNSLKDKQDTIYTLYHTRIKGFGGQSAHG
ncbi:hypothetical protein [Helicobacter labacensis]|uniref:hypothetical protein n=1 Tax=Helicobacter labacensis TaxID=2316079 RepID=UPI0013CE2899|nr:hypothetical protein [Helicobacter labacensis]